MNKEQFIEKLIERLDDQFYEEVSIKYIKSLIDELSEEREEQPTPLKVAIKGDGTEEYGKKIIEYFEKLGVKTNGAKGFLEEYYYNDDENYIRGCSKLPEGYTEINLKELKNSKKS